MGAKRTRLGQLLVDARLIGTDTLEEALELQKTDGRRLGTQLVARGLLDETQLTQILSHQLSIPWVSLLHIEFTRHLLNLVPRETAEKYCLVPIYVRHVRRQGDTLYVAMDDPSNEEALRECAAFSGLPTRAMIAPPGDIRNAIRVYYGSGGASRPADAPASTPEHEEADQQLEPPTAPEPAALRAARLDRSAFSTPAEGATPAAARDDAAAGAGPHSDSPVIEAVELELSQSARERVQALVAGSGEEGEAAPIPRPKGGARRMISVTLLDGTTITLPTRARRRHAGDAPEEVRLEPKPAQGEGDDDEGLTARDLVAALRAVAHGADPHEILGGTIQWERLFAALLSVLLKKHLIADWEYVEELKRT